MERKDGLSIDPNDLHPPLGSSKEITTPSNTRFKGISTVDP